MAVSVLCLVLFLAMTGRSSALYCICKDGLSDSVLQKNIDYACGAGADCAQILQNGPCYNPNTVKDHCNYAVNSYFQRKGQITGSCDFSGTATTTPTAPSSQSSTCIYPSSASSNGSTTPTGGTPSGTTPSTGGTPSGTTPSTVTPSTGGTVFGLGPSGTSSIPSTDNSATLNLHPITNLFCYATLALALSGFMF